MKLSDYLMDFGRVVAFYPNLKKVTNSTTATILLCQLMYWHKKQVSNLKESEIKAQDKWLKKNNRELTWETGLTYEEQKGARKRLRELGLLREQRVQRQQGNYYRVDFDKLNELWDIAMAKPEEDIPENDDDELNTSGRDGEGNSKKKESNYDKTSKKLSAIRAKIENKLNLIAEGKRWDEFVAFALAREERYNEPIDVYLDWAIGEGFDPVYWTPDKMKTTYPRAFAKNSNNKDVSSGSFISPLPKIEEKKVAPMPDDLKVQRKLY